MLDQVEQRRLQHALAGIGHAACAAVSRLTGAKCTVTDTPVGPTSPRPTSWTAADVGVAQHAVVAGPGVEHLPLLGDSSTIPWLPLSDAALAVDLKTYTDASERALVRASLKDVHDAASELLQEVVYGESRLTSLRSSDGGTDDGDDGDAERMWAKSYVRVLYVHSQRSVRTAIDVSALAEMKRYTTPPAAVSIIMQATLTLLAEGKLSNDALPPFDKAKLADWKGVRSLLHAIDGETLRDALGALEPTRVPPKVWAKVAKQLERATLVDAMRSSAPLAALFRYLKVAHLLSKPDELLVRHAL